MFIFPSFQGHDIGRNLLKRTLTSWKNVQITNRATMTFAFNPVSQFLYMNYGMYPREPAYYVEAPSGRITEKTMESPNGLDFEELKSLRDGTPILRKMDEIVVGFSLDWHHEYFFETKARCYIVKDKGNPVGYVYLSPEGRVGPMAVKSSEFTGGVLDKALGLAASQGVEKVRYWMPGSNIQAVKLALMYKMQLDPALFMCTKPFAKWENYIFSSAALM